MPMRLQELRERLTLYGGWKLTFDSEGNGAEDEAEWELRTVYVITKTFGTIDLCLRSHDAEALVLQVHWLEFGCKRVMAQRSEHV